MIKNILTADAMQGVRDLEGLRSKHQATIAKLRQRGIDATIHVNETPVDARIEEGRWIFDCPCGSGVNAHPDWPEARCMGCGAVFTRVVYPGNRAEIEEELVKREKLSHRNWKTETVDELRDERERR